MGTNAARILFTVLVFSYLGYTLHLYVKKMPPGQVPFDVSEAIEGRLVWQKYNCQSCHQLYGLGGYLGPDLTNTYSSPYKGENYIKGFIIGGTNQMPAFPLNEVEIKQLVEFLKMTDASGYADPRTIKVELYGMIRTKNDKK